MNVDIALDLLILEQAARIIKREQPPDAGELTAALSRQIARMKHPEKGMRKMQFTVKINLGNDAMQTAEDIAMALAGISAELERMVFGYTIPVTEDDALTRPVWDDNGNTVGEWSLSD